MKKFDINDGVAKKLESKKNRFFYEQECLKYNMCPDCGHEIDDKKIPVKFWKYFICGYYTKRYCEECGFYAWK